MGEWEKVRERRREREREGAQWLMLRVLFPARNSSVRRFMHTLHKFDNLGAAVASARMRGTGRGKHAGLFDLCMRKTSTSSDGGEPGRPRRTLARRPDAQPRPQNTQAIRRAKGQ
jgi:hypothetical protein